jgi:TonB family protein
MKTHGRNSMKSWIAFLMFSSLLWIGSLQAFAGEIKIIANASAAADVISMDELKKIYLRETNSLKDGTHVEPVLEKSGPAHQTFLKTFLDTNDDSLQNYYRTLVFTGKASMPKTLNSDTEVIAYVTRTRGAIGYVSAQTRTDGVKTLVVSSAASQVNRTLLTRVEPVYPETLKRLKIGGTVRLQVTISAKGSVERVEVLGGNPILGDSAAAAVRLGVYASSHSRTVGEVTIPFESGH